MSPQTEFGMFHRDVDAEISRELAGEKPVGEPTWAKYWQWRYDLLRFNVARGHTQSQQFIDYLHQARRFANLPLYDNGKPPSEAYYKAHAYQ